MSRDVRSIKVPVLAVAQPIGQFFVGVLTAHDLIEVASADMRRIGDGGDDYVGIQRKLSPDRVAEISEFVKSIDATFPTSVVISVRGECGSYDPASGRLTISEGVDEETGEAIFLEDAAHILDGQHRVEGLRAAGAMDFQVPVSIFLDADIADQAYIFATVNLAQTKVNRSLVYDLLDYAKARSPQKSCHDVVVAIDRFPGSPFEKMIKRLGSATPGRQGETLAQATVVNALLPFISKRPERDRYEMARGRKIKWDEGDYLIMPFRPYWLDGRDMDIAQVLMNYFAAVKEKWPDAWATREKGHILPRTNGFRAFMKLLLPLYLKLRPAYIRDQKVPKKSDFLEYLNESSLKSADFTVDNFFPGTSGEIALFKRLRTDLGL